MICHGFAWPEQVDLLAWTHRTVLGYFLAMSMLLGIYLSSQSADRYRALNLCGAAVCGVALVASMARGAWIFAIAGMLIQMRARHIHFRIRAHAGRARNCRICSDHAWSARDYGARAINRRLEPGEFDSLPRNLYLAAARSLSETWLLGAPSLEFGPYLAQFSVLRYPHLFNPEFATDSDVIHVTLLGGLPLLAVLAVALAKLGLRLWRDMKITGNFDPRLWLLLLLGAQLVLDNVFSSALGWFYLGVLCTAVPPPASAPSDRGAAS